jgi:hypothetical protein
MGDRNSVVGDESYRNIVTPHGQGRKNHKDQMLINVCETNGMIVTNTWFRIPREDCTHGRHQEIGVDISWTTCLWSIDLETVWRMCTLPGVNIDSAEHFLGIFEYYYGEGLFSGIHKIWETRFKEEAVFICSALTSTMNISSHHLERMTLNVLVIQKLYFFCMFRLIYPYGLWN